MSRQATYDHFFYSTPQVHGSSRSSRATGQPDQTRPLVLHSCCTVRARTIDTIIQSRVVAPGITWLPSKTRGERPRGLVMTCTLYIAFCLLYVSVVRVSLSGKRQSKWERNTCTYNCMVYILSPRDFCFCTYSYIYIYARSVVCAMKKAY